MFKIINRKYETHLKPNFINIYQLNIKCLTYFSDMFKPLKVKNKTFSFTTLYNPFQNKWDEIVLYQ